jgi:hypothetical protein
MIKFKNYRKNFKHFNSGDKCKMLDFNINRTNLNTLNNVRKKITLTNYGSSITNKLVKIQIDLD